MKFERIEIKRYTKNLRDELDGAALYAALWTAFRDVVGGRDGGNGPSY